MEQFPCIGYVNIFLSNTFSITLFDISIISYFDVFDVEFFDRITLLDVTSIVFSDLLTVDLVNDVSTTLNSLAPTSLSSVSTT